MPPCKGKELGVWVILLGREPGTAPPFLKGKEKDVSVEPSPCGPASLGLTQPVLGMTHFLPPAQVGR